MTKILWVGDACVASGFATVTHSVLDNLDGYEIYVLGVNYTGEPHDYQYKIWPSRNGMDVLGVTRIASMVEGLKPDVVILFNDLWVIKQYYDVLHKTPKNYKLLTYFPVDGTGYNQEWVDILYDFDGVAVYTEFAKSVVEEAGFHNPIRIIPHGVDRKAFFPVDKKLARAYLSNIPNDWFIVFNGNRNQARKRIDITIKGFCKFAADKPDARLYLHMGLKDVGWDLLPLMDRECKRHGLKIDERLIITNPELSPRKSVPREHLNIIYNCADVGVNTSLGEGFGLVNFEQSACGVPQIVPDYSACKELYEGRGLLLPIRQYITAVQINTEGGLVHEDDVAAALDTYYYNRDLAKQHAEAMLSYIDDPKFSWKNVAKQFDDMIQSVL